MIFYFSGCGNSKHVAEMIAAGLNDTLTFIPEAAREGRYEYTLAEGERLGFVFPIYSWAPPRCGLTEKVFRKAVEEKGWSLSACFSVQMPETYIGMAGFKLDTPENAHLKIERADDLLRKNITRLVNREGFSEMAVGSLAWLKTYMVNPGFNRSATDDSKYHVTEACIHCGKCAEVCPLKNITMEDSRPKWNGHCTMCMACYHHCPVNAIQYGKATEGKGQYYFGIKG